MVGDQYTNFPIYKKLKLDPLYLQYIMTHLIYKWNISHLFEHIISNFMNNTCTTMLYINISYLLEITFFVVSVFLTYIFLNFILPIIS